MRAPGGSPCMRRRLAFPAACALLPLLASAALGAPDGFVSERSARRRALDYLRFATEEVAASSILNAIAHMERGEVDRKYTAPVGAVDVDDWSATWDRL